MICAVFFDLKLRIEIPEIIENRARCNRIAIKISSNYGLGAIWSD
jgi:hypothetical protein